MVKCNLSRILGEKRILRVELSRQTGIAMYTLAQLYYDKWDGIKRDTINTLCKALSMQVGDLFEYVATEEKKVKETKPQKGGK
ncbi:MAG: helix-turn-helix domain-containing protein [Ignavibacteriales bacterium]